MKNTYNAEFLRDLARQIAAVQRPTNEAFWRDPKYGQAEHAVNKLLADLASGAIEMREGFPPVAG